MIGAQPTVGCLTFLEKSTSTEGQKRLKKALHALIPEDSWQNSGDSEVTSRAKITNSRARAILHSQEVEASAFVFLDFDEEEVIRHCRETRVGVEDILRPYVDAIKELKEAYAIGLGFELSPPAGLEEQALSDSGVAVIFLRNSEDGTWIRKQQLPLVGHYL